MTDQSHNKLILALVNGYLWVSSSDGQISEKEINCFNEALEQAGYGDTLTPIDDAELQHMFADVKDHFSRNFEDAVVKAKLIIEPFKASDSVNQIISISRKAVVIDEKLEEREEVVLQQIAQLLDVKNA
ncbi:MAG: TerB family tellurite resistance protein [Bdellovibrionaceae bacterium]|jgi:tellurite resistance protein|nr:TerB family tellurite resistance protein [Pseudobdellovibrionaceae bacterium]